jgi:hypothetical protein
MEEMRIYVEIGLALILLIGINVAARADSNPFDPYGNNERAQLQLQEQQEIYQQRQIANEQQWQQNYNQQQQQPIVGYSQPVYQVQPELLDR